MRATVRAESQQQFKHYLATWHQTIGKQIGKGVCATCHGNLGQGGYGPPISSSTLLTQTAGLIGILRNGFDTPARPGAMPPVGDTWPQGEINALTAYVKRHIYKAAPAGATSGG